MTPEGRPRENFVGDIRSCIGCQGRLVVTELMARSGTYMCKECRVVRAVDWAKRNRDKKRASNRKYQASISGKRAAKTARYRAKYPERARAHEIVRNAITNGSLQRQPCVACGNRNSHAHHDDYSEPLDIKWLCHAHHMQRHHALLAEREEGP